MGILDTLMSSDPMVSAQRRGILEQLASMSGPQPIAPSMGQLAGAVSAGARQGKRNYMADQVAEFQYKKMQQPNIDLVKDGKGGITAVKTPQLLDNGKTLEEQLEIETIVETPKSTLTTSQLKTNGEIKQARKTLNASYEKWKESSPDNKDKTLGDYVYATSVKKNTLTGLDEPDYETFTMKTAQKAMQKLYGEDPDFEATFNAIFDSSPSSSSLFEDVEPGDNQDSKSWFAETIQDWFGSKSMNPVEELDKMKTMPQDKAQEYYNTLPKKIQEQIRQIYNQ